MSRSCGARLRELGVNRYEEAMPGVRIGELPELPDPDSLGMNRKAMADSAALEFSDALLGIDISAISDMNFISWLNCFWLRDFGAMRFPPRGEARLADNVERHFSHAACGLLCRVGNIGAAVLACGGCGAR